MKASPLALKLTVISTLVIIAAFFISFYIYWSVSYRDRIYPGVVLGTADLSGKSLSEASAIISEKIRSIDSFGIPFVYNGKKATLSTSASSFDSDLSIPAISFDPDGTLRAAFGAEGDRTFWRFLLSALPGREENNIKVVFSVNESAVRSFLDENFPELSVQPLNAFFSLDKSGSGLVQTPERPGKEIDYVFVTQKLEDILGTLTMDPVRIRTRSVYPSVKTADLSPFEDQARSIIARGDLFFRLSETAEGTSSSFWRIKPLVLINWISVQNNQGSASLSLDAKKIGEFLEEKIAPEINQEAVLPRYEVKDGRVTSWQTGKNGFKLDIGASTQEVINQFLKGKNDIALITEEITGDGLNTEDNLNIKEIIGTGHSSFSGSPANRRHNIAVGAAALHGLLIKPGEEFSLIKTLGDVSDKSGYRPELVIKGDKTVPEFGGGLCQIGTTVFRTALASGLPITMRQNHSYRVSYYEPAGTDATIYVPQPDFRFVNDTGNYILIQARLAQSDLYFDFWGVKDGRLASTTYPTIYNIVKPEPTKIVESDELKPGEKKCTESSHNGADAYFDYTVIYPADSTTTPVHERRFKSHYIPWRAVCLVGKSATSTEASLTDVSATSTNQKAADNAAATDNSVD